MKWKSITEMLQPNADTGDMRDLSYFQQLMKLLHL